MFDDLSDVYATWLMWRLAMQHQQAMDILQMELREAGSDRVKKVDYKLRLNMALGAWVRQIIKEESCRFLRIQQQAECTE